LKQRVRTENARNEEAAVREVNEGTNDEEKKKRGTWQKGE